MSDHPKTGCPDIWGYMTILLICTPSFSPQMTRQWLAFRREWGYRAYCSFALPHLPREQGSADQHLPDIPPIQLEKYLIFNQNRRKSSQTRECRSGLCDIHPDTSPGAAHQAFIPKNCSVYELRRQGPSPAETISPLTPACASAA